MQETLWTEVKLTWMQHSFGAEDSHVLTCSCLRRPGKHRNSCRTNIFMNISDDELQLSTTHSQNSTQVRKIAYAFSVYPFMLIVYFQHPRYLQST